MRQPISFAYYIREPAPRLSLSLYIYKYGQLWAHTSGNPIKWQSGSEQKGERREKKRKKEGGKRTMIRGACIAGPSNIQYGPEGGGGGGPCPNNHVSRAPTCSYVLRLKGVSGESFAPRDVNTVACALARETRRALDPIQREREPDNPLQLVCARSYTPIESH